MSTTTANMALKIPSTNDSDYPASISESFTKLDLHDHSTGKGVPLGTDSVPTAAIQDDAVTTDKIDDEAVTIAKIKPRGNVLSNSSGEATLSADPAWQDVPNLSVSITTTGGPIWIGLVSDGASNNESVLIQNLFDTSCVAFLKFLRGLTSLGTIVVGNGSKTLELPGTTFSTIDFNAPAGTHTYKLQAFLNDDNTLNVSNLKLKAYELL